MTRGYSQNCKEVNVKLDEIARLAGVSRTTASYVINGKAKQYRVSDKNCRKSDGSRQRTQLPSKCSCCGATSRANPFDWVSDP